jgi:hypothetical protein
VNGGASGWRKRMAGVDGAGVDVRSGAATNYRQLKKHTFVIDSVRPARLILVALPRISTSHLKTKVWALYGYSSSNAKQYSPIMVWQPKWASRGKGQCQTRALSKIGGQPKCGAQSGQGKDEALIEHGCETHTKQAEGGMACGEVHVSRGGRVLRAF